MTVYDRSGRRDIAPLGFSKPIADRVMDEDPRPILAPTAKVTINGLPWRKVTGQEPPWATGSHDIKHGIKQFATIILDWSSPFALAGFGRRYERLNLVPFLITQVCWIAMLSHRQLV